MKLLMLLLSVVCLAVTAGAQETTVAPTEAPETTLSPETTIAPETDSTSTSSPETSEPTTTVLPDSTASSTTEEPSTTTTEVTVETTTAVNETTNGNSTDCKDTAPAVCKSFARLCQGPKRCGGKKGGSHEKSKEAAKKDNKSKEKPQKPSRPTAGAENDDDNDDAICAWARMQTYPQLREIAANCNQKNITAPLPVIEGSLIGRHPGPKPKPPKKPKDDKKQLDCRFREVASVFFRLLCPATCNVC